MSNRKFKRYTVTAALPYANGPLHIGHMAGAYVPSDIYVRYLRSQGRDVAYICGSDEHGVAITLRAKKEGITPKDIIDKYHKSIKDSFQRFGISFDFYHRTSEPLHHETSQEFFTKLYELGEFTEEESEQFYDEQYDQFLADRYIIGTCPNCSFENAYGDQCEKCGSSLNPTDLKNPRSALSGNEPVLRKTKHWYLPLDKYQEWLEKWLIEGKKGQWKSNVYGQCSSWIKAGLQPRAMTRDLDWGVDVPLKEAEGKKLYVWLDAPIGYVSATKQWAMDNGKDWELYWKKQPNPDDDSRLIHFIGKDNIVFHCIIFPSILNARQDYILPDSVPANEFLNLEGDKLSTSRNWAVWLHEYLDEFPGKQDELRYVLCSILPETKDSEFTWKDYQARVNNELVAILGNFINRAIVLTHKFCDGKVPQASQLYDIDEDTIESLARFPQLISDSLENFKFREALGHYIDLARLGNKYLADTEPWKLIKENPERVNTILNVALQIVANLSVVGSPFLPNTSKKINKIIGIESLNWDSAGSNQLLQPGSIINQPELLFEKVEDETIELQINKLKGTKMSNEPAESKSVEPQKDVITYDDFMKMDMRIGTILEAEKVPKSNKLLKFKVDTGIDQRTILSGIAKHYSPEEMVGKQVTVLVNLAPRKIMGFESEGMILMAENEDGALRLLEPNEIADNGGVIS